jgi:hypothetical protein
MRMPHNVGLDTGFPLCSGYSIVDLTRTPPSLAQRKSCFVGLICPMKICEHFIAPLGLSWLLRRLSAGLELDRVRVRGIQ